jgi:hypothetical protein
MNQCTGIKHDQGKAPLELLDPDALEGIARVLEFGAKKYDADNWRGGIKFRRILGAILRHAFALLRCHDTDPESGLPAVDHLACEVMFLSYFMKYRTDLDDRWRKEQK